MTGSPELRDFVFDPLGNVLLAFQNNASATITHATQLALGSLHTRSDSFHIEGVYEAILDVADFYPDTIKDSVQDIEAIEDTQAHRFAHIHGGSLAVYAALESDNILQYLNSPVKLETIFQQYIENPGLAELRSSSNPIETILATRSWANGNLPELDRLVEAVQLYYSTSPSRKDLTETAVSGLTHTAKHLYLGYSRSWHCHNKMGNT